MNRLLRLAACGVVSAIMFSGTPVLAQDAAVVKELSRLEDVWAAASLKKDGAAIVRLLSPGFLSMDDESGRVVDKATLVNDVNTRKETFASIANGNYKGQLFGNTAIIVGITTSVANTPKGPETRRYSWTDTWMKQPDGQWLCVASQSARLAK